MVKDPVQNNADILLVALFHQFPELFIGSESRINPIVVRRSVFVVKIPFENRSQIQALNTQLFQVRNLFHDPSQIAAHIVFSGRGISPRLCTHRIVAAVSIEKTLGKYLIINNALRPGGCSNDVIPVCIQVLEKSVLRRFVINAVRREIPCFPMYIFQYKIIFLIPCNFGKNHLTPKVIKQPVSGIAFHTLRLFYAVVSVPIDHLTFLYFLFGSSYSENQPISGRRINKLLCISM